MPKLSNMLGETGTVEIPVPGDEPLIVTYRRGALTPRLQARMMDAQARAGGQGDEPASGDALTAMCELFAAVVAGWNLTDDDGQVIPVTADSVADVDLGTLTLVMQRIGEAITPDPQNGARSNSGSSQTESSGPRRIGMAS